MILRLVSPLILVLIAACSAEVATPGNPAPAGSAPTPTDEAGTPGACTSTLANIPSFGGCGATYDATTDAAQSVACGRGATVSIGACGSLDAIRFDWGTHSELCLFAGTGSAPLVGALAISDENEYCDGTAYKLLGGDVPDACAEGEGLPLLGRIACASEPGDGGAD